MPFKIPDSFPTPVVQGTFNRYLYGLRLHPQNLANKRFVDCGCGNGIFVAHCLKNGITASAYGIDINLSTLKIETAYRDYFVQGTFQDYLPWDQLDYILFIHSLFYQDYNKHDFVKMLDKMLKQLKPTGEIRIYPLEYITKNAGDRRLHASVIKALKSRHFKFNLVPIEMNHLKSGLRVAELLIIRPKR